MAYWLDYSQGTLPASVIKAAGYEGVIRYVTAPRLMNPRGYNPKHTTKAEFDDHRRNGVKQLLVFQGDVDDADSGRSGGAANARLALEGANYLGYKGLIFFTNDRTTLPNPGTWRAYLDGAASVLGRNRVGAYGFRNAIDAARGHASAFWQSGRRSEVLSHTNFWQDNNTQVTVGGMRCDRNLPLAPMINNPEVPDMEPDENRMLREITAVVCGKAGPTYPADGPGLRTLLAAADAKLNGLTAAVAALSTDQDITLEEVERIIRDAIEQSIEITGTLHVGPSSPSTETPV